jgi:general secretion pathway protein D
MMRSPRPFAFLSPRSFLSPLAVGASLAVGAVLFAEEPPAPQATPEDTQRRMEEVLHQRAVKAEADRVAGLHALAEGRRLKGEGRFEEALKSLEQAVSLVPLNPEAQEELQSVRSALGTTPDRRKELIDQIAHAKAAREDQQRVAVEGKVREGERFIADHRYGDALQVLREAQETVRWLPYGSSQVDHWRTTVSTLLKQAEFGSQQEEAKRREVQMQKAETDAAHEYALSQQQLTRRVDALRAQGKEALQAERWEEAERVAREIDGLLPGDPGASQFRLLSRERRHVDTTDKMRHERVEQEANLREFSKEQQVPYTGQDPEDVMRHPGNWEAIRRRGQQAGTGESAQDPVWKQVLQERLRQQVHYQFEDVSFKDAKGYLEVQGRVVINVDKLAQESNTTLNDTLIQLASPDEGMSLESALNYLTKAVGLAWTLRDETIMITTEDGLKEKAGLLQYDVRDLIGEVQDYVGPTISIGGAGGTSNPGISFDNTAETDEEKKVTGETLVDFIKEYVDKPVWEAPENSIQFKNGRLFVTAPPDTQKRIREVLKGFREQRTLQVLIQARFLTVNDLNLQEMGVSWNGLNPALSTPPPGTGGGSGFRNSGVDDYRLGTTDSSSTGSAFLQSRFPRSFNGNLNPTGLPAGGLGGTIAFLDDFQVMAFIKAVEQSSKANLLTAPTLLCFNTQRANMVNVTQMAYVQDYTAVVQVQAVGYDPEIGYVMTGIVFDVRPIVSADRKYITLELRPTVSLLTSMRLVTVVSGATPLALEAPIVNMQAIRTTVSVPDGGTLLIGGLTNYDETSNYSGVPFISKIPFLSILFSYRGKANNRQSIVILVKAQIIDQREIEDTQYGKE